ncbi:MAG: heme NO-binding domain-containing protein [Anaerolineae bacterium]
MKGIVFAEFLEMVEEKYGWEMVDAIIEENKLSSEGAYTAVGTYNHEELVKMIASLSLKTGLPVAELWEITGAHLFKQLWRQHQSLLGPIAGTFEFLESVDQHIHVQVRKLYADANLPRFFYERPNDDQLVMTYKSERPLADLAFGMLVGCIHSFGESISIHREDIADKDGRSARFTITRHVIT